MADLTLHDLSAIAHDVIGGRKAPVLTAEMSAKDVPGWDSLNHTLIVMEIADRIGTEIGAREVADLASFGDLIAYVNARQADG